MTPNWIDHALVVCFAVLLPSAGRHRGLPPPGRDRRRREDRRVRFYQHVAPPARVRHRDHARELGRGRPRVERARPRGARSRPPARGPRRRLRRRGAALLAGHRVAAQSRQSRVAARTARTARSAHAAHASRARRVRRAPARRGAARRCSFAAILTAYLASYLSLARRRRAERARVRDRPPLSGRARASRRRPCRRASA